MNSEDGDDAGYPGFLFGGPPVLGPYPVTLRRVAWNKLSSVRSFSVSLGGSRFGFFPWLTTMIEYGKEAIRFVGVYRTEPTDDIGGGRWLCVRRSEWVRAVDVPRAPKTPELGAYLASGPQIAETYAFSTTHESVDLTEATAGALANLARGITISASEHRQSLWDHIYVDLADDLFFTSFDYSPILARCDALESFLPSWLELVESVADRGGTTPDDRIRLDIRHSVRELVNAPFRTPRSWR